jgi:hypothetical protein
VPLTATWDQVSKEFPMEAETIYNFNILLSQFFKAHSTDDDRHDLIDQICNAHLNKMRKTLQMLRLREVVFILFRRFPFHALGSTLQPRVQTLEAERVISHV